MSLDIDMETYGRNFNEPVAVVQQPVETNSYNQEDGEFVYKEFVEEQKPLEESPSKEEFNPQAEHFRALREEVDRLKSEREQEKREHQMQMELLRANQVDVPKPTERYKEMFDGMSDDEIPNVAELRREFNKRESEYQQRIEELYVQQMHPDYEEVIQKYTVPLVKQKPHLAEGLRSATNKALFAYELGAMAKQLQQRSEQPIIQQPAINNNAQRIVENSRKPGTLAQTGGQSALSKADYFATMSDQDFMKYASKNLEGI